MLQPGKYIAQVRENPNDPLSFLFVEFRIKWEPVHKDVVFTKGAKGIAAYFRIKPKGAK
jgi:hypothetical protein